MGKNEISHDGVVKEVLKEELLVEMNVTSACASCHAKSACMAHQEQKRLLKAKVSSTDGFYVGERVRVRMSASLGGKAVVLAYVFPLAVLLVVLLLSMKYLGNELVAFGLALLALGIYYFLLKLLSKKIATEFVFYAEKY